MNSEIKPLLGFKPYETNSQVVEYWREVPTCLKQIPTVDGSVNIRFFPQPKFVKQWEDRNVPEWLCDPVTRVFKTMPVWSLPKSRQLELMKTLN